jgi:diguanylate cyclase (GGDEF)-like protein
MFDIRSLFVVMVATNAVLAFSLWVGTGRRPQGGLGPWTLALVAQAAAFALFAGRGHLPDWASVVLANGLLGVSFSLMAAAILAFRGAALPFFVHVAAGGVSAFAVAALLHDVNTRLIASSLLFGAGQVVLLALAWKPVDGVSRGARGLFLASFALGAASFLSRAIGQSAWPGPTDALVSPSAIQVFSLMTAYTVVLLSSVSFLLMQKERADHVSSELASLDPLTGAFNRRTFVDLAEKQLSRARRLDAPLSLVLLDIDHFKRVNDTHGHLAGDQVLRRFAAVVRDQLRKEDVFVRYGGEEFCLLLPDVPGPGAVALAGRVRKAVAKASFAVDGTEIALTASAGVAARIDEGPDGLEALIARADEALYIAKSRGRNRVAAVSLGRSQAA